MKTLKAKEGYYLTQSADVAIQNRTITDCLYLPDTEDTSAWKEITSAEAEEFKKQLDAYNESQKTAGVDNSLSDAIIKKVAEINDYNESDNVNSLTYNGVETWLKPAIRSNYLTSISSAELLGETSITFAIAGQAVTVPLQNAKILLAKIQRYADASYLVTQQHIAEVSKLTTVAEVEAFDITQGYPEKLSF
jgi:hypothetical protein